MQSRKRQREHTVTRRKKCVGAAGAGAEDKGKESAASDSVVLDGAGRWRLCRYADPLEPVERREHYDDVIILTAWVGLPDAAVGQADSRRRRAA